MERAVGFEDFYRAERAGVLRAVVFTLNDRDLALEVTDEAFARAFERWADLSETGNRPGWVYRVAINLARNRFRRLALERRKPPPLGSEPWEPDRCADPAIAKALARLPIDQRSVVVLRFHLDWSVEEVAAVLEIAPGTVKSRLHRAMQKLATMLEDST